MDGHENQKTSREESDYSSRGQSHLAHRHRTDTFYPSRVGVKPKRRNPVPLKRRRDAIKSGSLPRNDFERDWYRKHLDAARTVPERYRPDQQPGPVRDWRYALDRNAELSNSSAFRRRHAHSDRSRSPVSVENRENVRNGQSQSTTNSPRTTRLSGQRENTSSSLRQNPVDGRTMKRPESSEHSSPRLSSRRSLSSDNPSLHDEPNHQNRFERTERGSEAGANRHWSRSSASTRIRHRRYTDRYRPRSQDHGR
ncbi:hypothetical protein BU24DRAFT_428818 [Aaosphaeria arxii CBS 175.79]|uniref:Uncharacterized protein n=1 Tax=Aaosphaeria arxii CBS 175.79 TaxID=1450172 RepID=A0A6A5X924_9PLEO|nr:uncharacterized protein BU24DRAFT_428818 [Aaosphaeria arxii CBS 175.79]KAF2009277.1 hypothetical protein BU24DRAFT_428818 [Aaosphaeria arxii CBS 175.79]